MAANATFALKAGVWFRRVRLLIISPDSTGTACPQSGRNSTYRPVQISGAGSRRSVRVPAAGVNVPKISFDTRSAHAFEFRDPCRLARRAQMKFPRGQD